MQRFTIPRDLYFGDNAIEYLAPLRNKGFHRLRFQPSEVRWCDWKDAGLPEAGRHRIHYFLALSTILLLQLSERAFAR